MSYEIIKSIKVKDNKVYIACASNNVYPKTFAEWESKSLSQVLQENGQQALDVEILKTYASGCFQRGNNKYVRALQVLRHMPEYHKFDWRNNWDEYKKNGTSDEYVALLKEALNTYLPKEKYIISQSREGQRQYGKKTRTCMKWRLDKSQATIYRYRKDAEDMKKCFYNSENWEIEQIK